MQVEQSMRNSGLLDQDDTRSRLWRLWGYVVAILADRYPQQSADFAAETRPIYVEKNTVFLPYENESVAEIVGRSDTRDHIAAVISEVMGQALDVKTCVIGGLTVYPS